MPKCFEPDRIFMQDNASIHTAQKVTQRFDDEGILVLDWPPYSPDMSPIEHMWARMKGWIIQHYPELSKLGKSQAAYDQLARVMEEIWGAVDQEYIDSLIRVMPRRVAALHLAKGWHTKY
jgi:DDE superfamily endonuclease